MELIEIMEEFDIGSIFEFFPNKTGMFQKKGDFLYIPNSMSFIDVNYMTSDHRPIIKMSLENDSIKHINTNIGRFPSVYSKKKYSIFTFLIQLMIKII